MKKNIKRNEESKQQVSSQERKGNQRATTLSVEHEPGKKGQREVRVVQVNGKPPLPGVPERTVGIDLGDKYCYWHELNREGDKVGAERVPTDQLDEYLKQLAPSRVVMETGTYSHWASRVAMAAGHEVYVANARQFRAIYQNPNKSDKVDAEMLARIGRFDPKLLHPVQLRSAEMQVDVSMLRARDQMVQARTKLISAARNLVKSSGCWLPKCDAAYFHRHAAGAVPAELRPAVDPLIKMVAQLTAAIQRYDQVLKKLAERKYPETAVLEQVTGVGTITALGYRLTLAEEGRFRDSRDVGPYLGLTPAKDQSGARDPELGISKAGDAYLRRLLVGSAHYILGPFGPDTDLRRFGQRLMGENEPGRKNKKKGKGRKKRAVVAVARKLSVLLHALWTSGEVYEPLRNSERSAACANEVIVTGT
jgi:transposase